MFMVPSILVRYMACPSESGMIKLCKGLVSLNARIYYKLKSGT
jgi:hypothetical protein